MMNVPPVKKELIIGAVKHRMMQVCYPLQDTQALFTFKLDYIHCVFVTLPSSFNMCTDIWKSIYTFAIAMSHCQMLMFSCYLTVAEI